MTLLLRSFQRSWTAAALATTAGMPLPSGEPVCTVAGSDPDRVLVVGGGPAAGPGVTDHSAGLPGCLARALAARTGRGATVEARGAHGALLEDVPGLVAGASLPRFDALVVFIGLEDGTSGVAVGRWRRALTAFVDDLRRDGPRDATIVLARIPPASSIGPYRGPLAVLADLRIRRLNGVADRLVRQREGVVRLAVAPPGPDAPAGSPQWYRRCGDEVADLLQGSLVGATA